VNVVRDVLDKRVVDRNGRDLGRADRILLRLRAGKPPVIEAIEIGPAALADRVHPVAGRWAVALLQACGVDPQPLCLEWKGLDVDEHVKADVAFGDTTAASIELSLRRLLRRIARRR
jgi:hypothetical protein